MIRNLFYILAGGLSFWLPPVIAAYIVRHEPNVVILILAPLLSLLLTYRLLVVREQTDAGPSVAVLMIIGVFLLGPTLMYAQTTSYGAGFLTLHETTDWLMLILFTIFPVYTLIMSGYGGTFFPLVIGCSLLIWLRGRFEPNRWIFPFRRASINLHP